MLRILKKSVLIIVIISTLAMCSACTSRNESSEITAYTEEQRRAVEIQESSIAITEIPNKSAGVYVAEPKSFSKEDIDNFLSYCEDSVAYPQDEVTNTSIKYYGTCNSGRSFFSLESTGYHPHVVFQYVDQEKYDTYSAYPIYTGEEAYETNSQYSVGWMFTEVKDFSFASEKEAEEYVRAALSVLGLSDVTLFRTLYIDHNTMMEAGKKLSTDPIYAPIGEKKENNGYPIRNDWSELDDAYMFSFGISVDNTTLSPRFEIRETATYIGSEIIVWYSASGIDFLSIEMPWDVGELVQEPEPIVSAEVAMDIAKEKMESILTFNNITYSNAYLEYQYRQDGANWVVFPVWTIKVSYQPKDNTSILYTYVSVDAFTGKEL